MRKLISLTILAAALSACASSEQALEPAKYLDTAVYVSKPDDGDLPTVVERNGKRCILRRGERCNLGDIVVELPR